MVVDWPLTRNYAIPVDGVWESGTPFTSDVETDAC